ncbi:MAG: aminotransferase class I/II-fold pyridoxal phosphate-dependent enzyme, partial [Afipia sp.]|nr:aminotransferase class I/II-fold pyridoxal phosphate-dependent enzyme [Afipia sp.]
MNQHLRPEPVAFIDIGEQRRRLGSKIDNAVSKVLTHCQFINGPEVMQFEQDLAAFCGAKHVVACASGTDALLMVLMAKGVGPGDAVICPSFTFCATGEVVALAGATPVFVDVDETTFNINAESLKKGIATAKKLGLKVKAVIPVDLFGQSADHDAVAAVAKENGIFVLDDAAQSFGATYKGKRLGTLALATATSFFPAKPLGCYGDGGAIFTDDADLAEKLRSVRVHGSGTD